MTLMTTMSISRRLRQAVARTLRLAALALALAAPAAAATPVDPFTDAQGPVSATAGSTASSVLTPAATTRGNERDILVTHRGVSGNVSAQAGGQLLVSSDSGQIGEALVAWDGVDGDASNVAMNLGPIDVTGAGADREVRISVLSATAGSVLVVELFSTATDSSVASVLLPAIASATDVHVDFANFITRQGAGVTLTSVRAITLLVRPAPGGTVSIETVDLTADAPAVTASKTDSVFANNAGGTAADPTDVLEYTVIVGNTGSATAGAAMADTLDPNTNLVAGTVEVSPVAHDNVFAATGSQIVVPAPGVLGNDVDPDGDTLFVNGAPVGGSVAVSTSLGGTVMLSHDGSFTYAPPVGSAYDTFGYAADDGNGVTMNALVTVRLDDLAPTVTTTVPANGAPGVLKTATVTVTFSEPVTAAASAATFTCTDGTTTTTVTYNQSQPTTSSLLLTPAANLPVSTVCTVVIDDAKITDNDLVDPPNTMAADHTFGFNVPPQGVNDTFATTVTGNIQIDSGAIASPFTVITNDDVGPLTTVTTTGLSAQGGNVVIVASGANRGQFTYDPPAGYTGSDSFGYTLNGGASGNGTGTVSITTVAGMIWFVNNNAASCTTFPAGNCGRLSTPFSTLDAFRTANTGSDINRPEVNEPIFVYESGTDYQLTGSGLSLRSGQIVIGQDSTDGIQTIVPTLNPAQGSLALPAVASGNATLVRITAASSVNPILLGTAGVFGVVTSAELRGFTIGSSPLAASISGGSFGTLRVKDVKINNAADTALSLATGSFGTPASFDSITSGGGPGNVILNAIGGSVALGTGALSGASAASFQVSGGTVGVTYGGTINQGNNQPLLQVAGGHATGTIGLSGALGATNGTGLQFTDADGTYNLSGVVTLNGGDAGVDVAAASNGTINASNTGSAITSPSGTAFSVAGGGSTVTWAGTVTQNNAQRVVDIQSTTGGSVSFSSGAVTGGASSTGINLNGANGNVTFASLTFGTSGVRMTNQAVTITNGSSAATYSLGAVSIFTSNAIGLNALNFDGTLNIASGTVNTQNRAPMIIDGPVGKTNLGITLADVTSTTSTVTGLWLEDVVGSFSATAGALTDSTSQQFLVINSNATVSHGGTISSSNVQTIAISGNTGGTITMGGAVTATGLGIALANNTGTTINFNGTLSASNATSTTFTATGGGTINLNAATNNVSTSGATNPAMVLGGVTLNISSAGALNVTSTGAATAVSVTTGATTINSNGGGLNIATTGGSGTGRGLVATSGGGASLTITGTNNVINSGSGSALNVASTTIGAGNLNFLSITSTTAGTAAAIIVENTGPSGGLVVTGSGTTAGSGGTISNKSGANDWVFSAGIPSLNSNRLGAGLLFNNTRNASISNMNLSSFSNGAIVAFGASNLAFANVQVSGANGDDPAQDESAIFFYNVTGTASLSNCSVSGGLENNLHVLNQSGTLNRLTIDQCTFGFNNTASGNNNILIDAQNSGTILNFTLQSSVIKGARADWINFAANSSSSMDAVIGGSTPALGNTFDNLGANAHPGAAAGGNRVVAGVVGTGTIDIRNNTMKGAKGEAIRVRSTATGAVTGTVNARVRDNTVGVQATSNSGSTEGSGIFAFGDGGSRMTIAITDNKVYQYNNHGIRMLFGDEINNTSAFNATVTGNTVSNPGNLLTDFNGILLTNGSVGGTDDFITCLDIGGSTAALKNTVTGSGSGSTPPNNAQIRLNRRFTTTVRLPGYGGAANDNAAVESYVSGRNTLTTVAASSSGGFTNGTCTTPSFP